MWTRAGIAVLVACHGGGDPGSESAPTAPVGPAPIARSTPIVGGTLAVSPDGALFAAADVEADRVVLVDVASRALLGEVRLEEGDEPARLLVDDDGVVFAALRRGGAVAVLDPVTGQILSRTPTCPSPRGLARDGDTVWLACASGELVALDAATGAARSSVFVAYDLRDVVPTDEGLLVSTFKRAELLTVSRDGVLLDRHVAPTLDNELLDAAPDTLRVALPAGAAWRTVPHPAGGVLMFHQRANERVGVDGAGGPVHYSEPTPDSPLDPRPGCFAPVHAAATWFPPSGDPITTAVLARAVLPVDGAITPQGAYAVVSAGANDALGVDAPDVLGFNDLAFDTTTQSCVFGDETRIADDSKITSLGYAAGGVPVGVGVEPFRVYVDGVAVAGVASLDAEVPDAPSATHGSNLFHLDVAAGMACASCHLEGQEDGRTWVFPGIGKRRTQSMAGSIASTAPFHWGGEFAHFQELMEEVMVGRMGRGAPIEPADVQALAFWMEGLETTPVTPRGEAAAIARGEAVFHDPAVGCAGCHAGELFTANLTVDVGTGREFQVPSLLGVGYRFPYLHDGCATELRDRFGPCGGGDAHGMTSHLRDADLDALVAYLQTL